MKQGILCFLTALLLASCGAEKDSKGISEDTIQSLLSEVKAPDKELLERGIRQTAALWTEEDGSEAKFTEFVKANYASDPQAKEVLFNKLSNGCMSARKRSTKRLIFSVSFNELLYILFLS